MTRGLAFGLVALLAAGCGAVDPYVYTEREFDRSAPGFGREPEDLTEVTVCYSRLATAPATVRALAEDRCGAFDRLARFREHGYGDCALLTPVAAHFDCVRR